MKGIHYRIISVLIILCSCNSSVNRNNMTISGIEKIFQIEIDTLNQITYCKRGIEYSTDWIYPDDILIRIDNYNLIKDELIKKFHLKMITPENLENNLCLFLDTMTHKTVFKSNDFEGSLLWKLQTDRLDHCKFPKWWTPCDNIFNNYANYIYFLNDSIKASSIDSTFNGRLIIHVEKESLYIFLDIVGLREPFKN